MSTFITIGKLIERHRFAAFMLLFMAKAAICCHIAKMSTIQPSAFGFFYCLTETFFVICAISRCVVAMELMDENPELTTKQAWKKAGIEAFEGYDDF